MRRDGRPHASGARGALTAAGCLALLACAAPAGAHPLSFGSLELREGDGGRVAVTWRYSGTEQRVVGAEPALPAWCAAASARDTERVVDGVAERWSVACGDRGLSGAALRVRGLDAGVQVIVRRVGADGAVDEAMLDAQHPEWRVPVRAGGVGVLRRYVGLGVEHILTGHDHLAFVLGLLLAVRHARALVAAITAFTLGHSVTLALASLGLTQAPVRAVEAAIAWSIVVVAREALRPPQGPAAGGRAPWALAALFGLLHGFGFAGALAEVGLPRERLAAALFAFNVGVELGQLAFVGACLAVALAARRAGVPGARARAVIAYAIGVLGAYWCVARAAAFGQ